MIYKYTIPLPPITKKNSQRILRAGGRSFIAPSAAYAKYEQAAMWYLTPKPRIPIAYSVQVVCIYYMLTRRRVDLTNLCEATHDILVKAGVLADDNRDIVASLDGSRVFWDKENPRTEIIIKPLADYDQWRTEQKDGYARTDTAGR